MSCWAAKARFLANHCCNLYLWVLLSRWPLWTNGTRLFQRNEDWFGEVPEQHEIIYSCIQTIPSTWVEPSPFRMGLNRLLVFCHTCAYETGIWTDATHTLMGSKQSLLDTWFKRQSGKLDVTTLWTNWVDVPNAEILGTCCFTLKTNKLVWILDYKVCQTRKWHTHKDETSRTPPQTSRV